MDKADNNTTTVSVSQAYSGPVPPASELIKYNQACPDAADRILRMAENEAKHRHEMQLQEQKDHTRIALNSMYCAFLCVAILGGVLAYSIYAKQTSTAIGTCITAIAGVAGLFFWNKKAK